MNPTERTTMPHVTSSPRVKPPAGYVSTMARAVTLDPALSDIRERSDQTTRSAALVRVIGRHEAGEQFAPPRPGGPSVQLAWTLPARLAARFPLRAPDVAELAAQGIGLEPYPHYVRTALINAALFEMLQDFKGGWGELVGVSRGWNGSSHQFPGLQAWTAGAGRVVTRGVLRRTGGYNSTLPLEERPIGVGRQSDMPVYPRDEPGGLLWEVLELGSPEPRTLAVLRAESAYAAVQAVRAGKFQDLGLEPLDAQRHRPWRGGNAASKAP